MTIKLHFHGATRTVTGSCYLLETEQARVLVRLRHVPGLEDREGTQLPRLPVRSAQARRHAADPCPYRSCRASCRSWSRPASASRSMRRMRPCDLCAVMLPDSGFIQETEVRQLNERNRKRGLPEVEPIYTAEDARQALEHFEGIAYKTWITPVPGIRARYWNAGHLLGSASIEVEVERAGEKPLRILFSGDIGPDHKLLEPDPEAPADFDYVICESTYGGTDRFERSRREAPRAAAATNCAPRRAARAPCSFPLSPSSAPRKW